MTNTTKLVAWTCIFSTLFAGCYSSALIDPTGKQRERINTDRIRYVIRKDRAKFVFVNPPAIVKDTIVGLAGKEISIPMVDVGRIYAKQSDGIDSVIMKDGMKYEFVEPPAILKDAILGAVGVKKISMPLSDVALVYVKQPSASGAILGLMGVLLIIGGIVWLSSGGISGKSAASPR